ncbi:MAG: hypothetical protein FGM44_14265 [Limnohabitans sp.]|nr:hypothetical protein [Limnohabitans sp.]
MDIEQIQFLSPQACSQWAEQVLSLRRAWTARHDRLPFYTLGMAAYLDAVPQQHGLGGAMSYQSAILRKHANGLIMKHFSGLLESCRQALGQHFQCEARYIPDQAALPGFHIHLPHPAFAASVASVHQDLQYLKLFPQWALDPHQLLTFTVPLSLPEGSGLKVWDTRGERFHLYTMGHIVVHNGLERHQAVLHPQECETPRIMLQGHGVFHQQELLLYW